MASVRKDIATINRFVDEPLLVLNGRTVETDLGFFLRRLARTIRYRDRLTCRRACLFRKSGDGNGKRQA